jgi:two-component system cell cycle response regulator DivK
MKLFGGWNKPSAPPAEEKAFVQPDTTPSPTAPETTFGGNRRILVVDDNPVVLKAFELKLKSHGFQVMTATEGSGAVSLARQERPDLIVLDIHFPPQVGSTGLQWNGFNIMQWMQRFNEAANIPVIIITSDDITKFKDKALHAGAVACFQKPIDHEEFIRAVSRALGPVNAKSQAA